jgi:hypothetical protein
VQLPRSDEKGLKEYCIFSAVSGCDEYVLWHDREEVAVIAACWRKMKMGTV